MLHETFDHLPPPPGRPTGRCPSCGHVVYLPCLICRARAALAAQLDKQRLRLQPDPDEPLRIQLRGLARKRYHRIHARKVRKHLQQIRRNKRLPPCDAPAAPTHTENDQ